AQALILQGEIESAESQWRKILEINPRNMAAIAPLVEQLLKRGDHVGAEIIVADVTQSDVTTTAPLELLIQIRAARKDWRGAILALNRLEDMPNATPVATFWSGFLAAKQGRSQDAIGHFQHALAIQPDYRQALEGLSRIYQTGGHNAEWIAYLTAYTKQNPDSVIGLEFLASAHVGEKNWRAAENCLLRAGAIQPANTELMLKRLDVVERQDSARAESQLTEWIKNQPDEFKFKMRLADFYATRKRYSEAESLLRVMVNQDSTAKQTSAVKLKLAELALLRRDMAAANAYLDEIFGQQPDHLQALRLAAQLYVMQNDIDKAIEAYKRVLKRTPLNDEAANNLADLLATYRADDKDSMAKATTLVERFEDARHPALLDTYGWVQLKAGNIQQAVMALRRAEAGAPNDPRIHYHLAEAYSKTGNTQAAIGQLQRSLADGKGEFLEIQTAKALLQQLQKN
ncbi:MAG: tetratricopeptide repeat protein, partial [Methylomonas sp.]|nr:tetratricopeptide repeat protein [Methylomonas sp.]